MTSTAARRVPTPADPVAALARRRRGAVLAGGLVASVIVLAVAVLLSIAVGSNSIPFAVVWESLWATDGSYAATVVDSRLPRTALGLVVGAALGLSGAVIQGITRNPLGDPGLLGVNAGASASVVTVVLLTGSIQGRAVWAALPGAVVAAVVVYVVGSGRRGPTPVRLILAGAAVTAALTAYVQAIALTNSDVFDSYRSWVVGSLAGRSTEVVVEVLPFFVVGAAVALLLARRLNALALGDDTATSLGLNAVHSKVLAGAAAILLCATATAAAGPIAFLGLAVPHIARSVTGGDYRWLLPYSVVLGAALLLLADVLGRVVVRPGEVMVGTVTAFVGAPFLIAAVRRRRSGL